MCTKTIVESTTAGATGGAAAGSLVFPIVGTLAGGTFGAAAGAVKGVGKELKAPDLPPVKPPRDIAGEEKRRREKSFQRTLAGRPGRGRSATIFSQGTGSGQPGLKTKTGQ